MRIGLYGGSFNPPHIGHGIVCYYLLETSGIDAIWLIPTFRHAFAKPLAPYDDRLEMCRLLAKPFQGRVQVSDIERTRRATSYTIDTVRAVLAQHPEHDFEWIMGSDILRETDKWKDFEMLKQLVQLRVIGRGGYPGADGIEMPEVSSTQVRQALRQAHPPQALVPRNVLEYIASQGLYQDSNS